MKFFGRKSAGRGVSRPALLRAWSSWGSGGEIPRSYEDRVREGYVNNPVAQRAVRLVAEGVGSAPVSASVPAVLPLLHAKTAGQGLVETVAMQLLLHGNAYVQVLCGADGSPAELFALRPERVTIEADARGWPVAFLYKAGEATMRIAAEDAAGRPAVIHIKAANPLDDHYGLGCLGAAAGAVAIHNAATTWNKALLDNAARPSGAMVYEPGEPGAALSAEQFERLRTELDASFSGAGNAGRPMLLEGGLRWQALSLSPADMDFVGLKAASAREIALAFGVPSMLLGLPGDSGYANYREANKALWRLAILPVAATVLGGIADGLKGWFPGLALTVDLDQVPALSEERERLWGQVTAADFLTREEKRAMLGFDRVSDDALTRSPLASRPLPQAGEVN
jgi:HK97 family phage portal protein